MRRTDRWLPEVEQVGKVAAHPVSGQGVLAQIVCADTEGVDHLEDSGRL